MFDVGKSKFYKKSKQLLKLLKTRIDTIIKKRHAVHKYLRSDIAELIKNGLDVNAYGRVEGLLVELNISSCYDFVEQCIMCISSQLSAMENQRECPTECREAVPSLIHAAARFADLPELRELRTVFTNRYGTSLEPFINKEFVEKLRAGPPTKEKKLQLMKAIAQENSIQWNSTSLEQKMFKSPAPAPAQDKPKHPFSHGSEDNRGNWHKRNYVALPGRDGHNDENKASVMGKYDVPKGNKKDFAYHGRKAVPDNRYNVPINSDEVVSNNRRDSTRRGSQQTSSSSVGSFSEDEVDSRKPFYHESIPSPYVKRNTTTGSNGFVNAKQNSSQCPPVNTLKPLSGREIFDNESEERAKNAKNARQYLHSILKDHYDDPSAEEKKLDELLMRYSKKKPPGQESDDGNVATRVGHKNERANVYPSPGRHYDETNGTRKHRSSRSELPHPPARETSLPLEQAAAHEATRGHARAMSLQPDLLSCPGHVHPKLPDYDNMAARLAALRRP